MWYIKKSSSHTCSVILKTVFTDTSQVILFMNMSATRERLRTYYDLKLLNRNLNMKLFPLFQICYMRSYIIAASGHYIRRAAYAFAEAPDCLAIWKITFLVDKELGESMIKSYKLKMLSWKEPGSNSRASSSKLKVLVSCVGKTARICTEKSCVRYQIVCKEASKQRTPSVIRVIINQTKSSAFDY